MAAVTSKEPSPRSVLALGLAWLLGLAAALQILDRALPSATLAAAILGALAVDVGATRAGVLWDDDATESGPPPRRRPVQRLLIGAAAALAVGVVVIALGASFGWLHHHGSVVPSTAIVFALLRAAAVAVRDELLYRGLPLAFAARAGVPAPVARVFAALTGGAAIALVPGVGLAAVALAVASGWLFASLWQRDRGAWAAFGAHGAWILLFGSILHGGLFDTDWVVGNLAIGNTSTGAPAWLASALLVAAGLAVVWLPGLGPGGSEKERSA
jgi:hypothetical protein